MSEFRIESATSTGVSEAGSPERANLALQQTEGPSPDTLLERIKFHDTMIRERIAAGLEHARKGAALPEPVKERLATWERELTSPADIEMIKQVRRMLTEGHENRSEYARSQIESKMNRHQLELAMKGLSKSMSGIQQLLSAQ